MVTQVKCDGLTCQQTAHEEREGAIFRLQQEMEVIGHERPSDAGGLSLEEKLGKAVNE